MKIHLSHIISLIKIHNMGIKDKIKMQYSYWIEGFNTQLYSNVIIYQEEKGMTDKQMSDYLNLNEKVFICFKETGDINFSIEMLIKISLKVNCYPILNLEKF